MNIEFVYRDFFKLLIGSETLSPLFKILNSEEATNINLLIKPFDEEPGSFELWESNQLAVGMTKHCRGEKAHDCEPKATQYNNT